jgi:hypothetical protein
MFRLSMVIPLVMCFSPAWVFGTEPQISPNQPVVLERPGDRPAPEAEIKALTHDAGATSVIRNGFLSVQVNVNHNGQNTRGDAANEPSLAVDPTAPNRMVIGWRQFDSIESNFREAGVAWSDDGGRTWTNPGSLDNGIFRSDPVLACDGDGHFFYNSLSIFSSDLLQAEFFDSNDGGRTWAGPEAAFGGDKVWVTIDRTDGIGRGNIYQSWSTAGNRWDDRVFSRSTDGGRTFSDPLALIPPPIWGTLAVGREGELYLAGNAGFDYSTFIVWRSLNVRNPNVDQPTFNFFFAPLGGRQGLGHGTFETPNPQGLLGQVWLAADTSDGPNSGNLYLLSSVDPSDSDPQDVHFIRSTDRGETWSSPITVNTDDRDAWQWFGTMSVAPNGRIDVVWIESLTHDEPNVGEIYYSNSSDGGLTWSNAIAISPTFDSFLGFPQQNKMGDYYHMRSDLVGADLAFTATFNEEEDVYYVRIGDRDCDGNGVGDGEDLASGGLKDCDDNEIPDVCEIAARPELDLDGNGWIDACEPAPRRGAGRAGY